MNIDELPDHCLLHIFYFFNDFDILMNCSRVCERWKYLVLERLHNVKYLTNSIQRNYYPASTVYFSDEDRLEQIAVSEWFPKLKILDVNGALDIDFISNLLVPGLRLTSFYENLENITLNNPCIEMIAASSCYNFFANDIQGPMIKQLFISRTDIAKFSKFAKYFPNLRRLHIDDFTCYPPEDKFYTGPVLEKLEILEICFHAQAESWINYGGFSLADRCPILKSAFHFIQNAKFVVNSEIKNHCLEDLVLLLEKCNDWSVIRRILSKYPNLKHLRITRPYDLDISDDNIPEILSLLPFITLIEIRNSEKITEKSVKYIDRYCEHHGRSISFYYQKRPKITKKWPHLRTKRVNIGEGLDFMKYCFLMDLIDLPCLLDPIG